MVVDEVSHLRSKLDVVDYADRCPPAGTTNRALLPPPSHDDNEITPAENRAVIVASNADATATRGSGLSGFSINRRLSQR